MGVAQLTLAPASTLTRARPVLELERRHQPLTVTLALNLNPSPNPISEPEPGAMTQRRRASGGSAAGSSSDVGSTAGRRRKSMPTEASVALRCLRATVAELEEAHEALGALLRLNDSAAWQKQLEQKDAELASLRAELRATAAQALTPNPNSG